MVTVQSKVSYVFTLVTSTMCTDVCLMENWYRASHPIYEFFSRNAFYICKINWRMPKIVPMRRNNAN